MGSHQWWLSVTGSHRTSGIASKPSRRGRSRLRAGDLQAYLTTDVREEEGVTTPVCGASVLPLDLPTAPRDATLK
jgi:hypothetical protein